MLRIIYLVAFSIATVAVVFYILVIVAEFIMNLKNNRKNMDDERALTRCQAAAKAKKCTGKCYKCPLYDGKKDNIVEIRK